MGAEGEPCSVSHRGVFEENCKRSDEVWVGCLILMCYQRILILGKQVPGTVASARPPSLSLSLSSLLFFVSSSSTEMWGLAVS